MRISITLTPKLATFIRRLFRAHLYVPTRYEVWNV